MKMADVAVKSLDLLQTITPLLLSIVNLPTHVADDMKSMRSWLESMQAFIEDNYGRQGNETLAVLVTKVGKTACEIEDVVDLLMLHSPPYLFHHHRITRTIHYHAHQLHHHFPLKGVSDKIKSIMNQIEDIKSQSVAFPVGVASSSSTNRAIISPLLFDNDMVGYEDQKAELMRRLVDDGDNRLLTVAVDGPHASGKTTLVKNVFWKPQIRAQFDCYAWVSVSQHPDIGKICQDMLRQLCNSRRETYPGEDGSRLKPYLVGKKYLIVVDDISENQQWSNLKNALPDSNCGSRIILTTRHSNLSSIWSYDHRLRLHGLESSDARKLFFRRAFPGGECPFELIDISSQIMARCEGLPLAIVAVAGTLAHKSPTRNEWELFHSNLGSGMGSLSAINNALLLNYLDLPSKLKCCFLYMSIFPEDYTVERGRLIHLWVAEGFATSKGHRTAEEVAEDYLNQLIHRNLLQVSSWGSDGRPNNCRVGNIVLKFIIQKCKDDCFASIFTKDDPDQAQTPSQRRVSVHGDYPQHLLEKGDFARVRSMLLFRCVNVSVSVSVSLSLCCA